METKDIQKSLYFYCKQRQHEFMVSNKHLHKWFECDFMSITKAGYLTEFEIKQTKSDFKRDFVAKKIKHEWFKGKRTGQLLIEESWKNKTETIVDTFTQGFDGYQKTFNMEDYCGPNQFYYVCPIDIIDLKDVPSYAGLIYAVENNTRVPQLRFIREAPKLHKNKADEARKLNIMTRYMYDYWKHTYEKK